MKCYKCNKQIPSISTICPYCSTPVDKKRQVIDFGDITNLNYDNQNDLKAYIQEPEKRKKVVIAVFPCILVLIVFISLGFFIFFPKKEHLDKYFIATLDIINDYIEDSFLNANSTKSGEYKLDLNINGEIHEFNGRYERDVSKKILKLSGVRRDPGEQTGGIILDSEEFSFETYLSENNLYFKSEQIFNDYLKFELPDETGLLTTKNYNLNILLSGLYDGLRSSLSQVNYNRENVKINYRGVETKTTRYYFTLGNKEKLNFIKTFYETLIDDTNFVNELARLNNRKSDEIIEILKNKIIDAEFRYSGSSNDSITFSIYVNNKSVIRYYIDDLADNHRVYQLDIKDGKYFFDYFVNDKNEISASLFKSEEEVSDIKAVNYIITLDNDQYVMDISLTFKEDDRSQVKKETIESYRDFTTITEEEGTLIKSNLLRYTGRDDLFDNLSDYFKEKCVLGLECNCEENQDVCSCLFEGKIIECPKNKVTQIVEMPIEE